VQQKLVGIAQQRVDGILSSRSVLQCLNETLNTLGFTQWKIYGTARPAQTGDLAFM